MKFRKTSAVLLAVLMAIFSVPAPAVSAETGVVFSLSCSLGEEESPELGDTVTYTVGITKNSGFCVGTMFFMPSDNLTYLSSTLLGKDCEAKQAVTGDNTGAWGIVYMLSNYSMTTENFCTMTFRVDGTEDISIDFYAYQLKHSSDLVNDIPTSVLPSSTITYTVVTPDKPAVTTTVLPGAVLGQRYSFPLEANRDDYISWEVTSGSLPDGLELLNDGTLLGIPTEFGEFTFGVKVSILDTISSDEANFTLTVLEKPKKLELTDTSKYIITEEAYITKVVAETKYSDFIGNFLNAEYVKIYDGNGNEVTDESTYIGTGFTVKLMDGETAVDSAEVVVLGDINGDGNISSVDYLRLRAYFSESFELTGAYLSAAHVAGNENVTSVDYLRLRAYFNGDYNIYN